MEFVCRDAVEFPIPDGPLVTSFYNPFRQPVVAAVLANLRRSLEEHPRLVIVIYINPECRRAFSTNRRSSGKLRPASGTPYTRRNLPEPSAVSS